MARATTPKGPKPHESKWTLVFSIKVMRFDTLQEAEAERDKALVRGEALLHPAAARSIGGQVLTRQAQSWQRAQDKPGSSASIGQKDALRMARR